MSSAGSDPAVTAPIPIQPTAASFRTIAGLFRLRNYRALEVSLFSSSIATWMSRVAIDWLLLELTGDLALVGLAVTLQFGPTLLFGVQAGVLADRLPRKRIILVTQSVTALSIGVLAVLAVSGVIQFWQVYIAVAVAGIAGAIEGPARTALLGQIIEPGRLRTAVSVNGSVFHIGGLVGPAISGLLIAAVGSGWSIAASVGATLVSLVAIALLRSRDLTPVTPPPPGSGGIRIAVRYALRKPTIHWPILLLAFVATFGMTLPVLFTTAAGPTGFDTGSAGYGLYTSLAAVGAVSGAILSTRFRRVRLRTIVFLTGAYGAAILLAGVVPLTGVFLAGIVALGLFRLLFATGADSMVQLSTNLMIRGRVVAIYIVVLVGGQAAGGALLGVIAEHLGMVTAFVVAGGMPLLAAIVVGLVLARRGQLTVQVDLRSMRRLVTIVRRQPPKSTSFPSQRSDPSTEIVPPVER